MRVQIVPTVQGVYRSGPAIDDRQAGSKDNARTSRRLQECSGHAAEAVEAKPPIRPDKGSQRPQALNRPDAISASDKASGRRSGSDVATSSVASFLSGPSAGNLSPAGSLRMPSAIMPPPSLARLRVASSNRAAIAVTDTPHLLVHLIVDNMQDAAPSGVRVKRPTAVGRPD